LYQLHPIPLPLVREGEIKEEGLAPLFNAPF